MSAHTALSSQAANMPISNMPTTNMPATNMPATNMVLGQLATNAIQDETILSALRLVAREAFVPQHRRHVAYIDENVEIAPGRFLLAPLTVARMLEVATFTPSCRVLIIGDGTGYIASLVRHLAGHIVAIDSDADLLANTGRLGLKDVDAEYVSNMAEGFALSAPYDVIFINGAVEYLPEHLTSQLAIGGRLVAIRSVAKRPGGRGGLGKLIVGRRLDGHLHIRECFDVSAAIVPQFEQADIFQF